MLENKNNNNNKNITTNSLMKWFGIIAGIFIVLSIITSIGESDNQGTNKKGNKSFFDLIGNRTTFNILASQENEDSEDIIKEYAKKKGYDVNIQYEGTIDMMDVLNSNSEEYDAVWASNSIWLYMLDKEVKLTDSKFTSINPVVLAIKKSKAEKLGMVNSNVYTKDIVKAISDGSLKFAMSNPSSTNSGASAYLGLLSALAGNPEVLTDSILEDEKLKEDLKTFFSELNRSSGDENFLEEIILGSDYDAVYTYECSIININKKLIEQNQEPFYAIYPVDGVSISDSPFAYIDNGVEEQKEIFEDIRNYLLSDEGQQKLQEKGRRTWYGGINTSVDKKVFNPDWGIDTSKYISPLKYPSTAVIKKALNIYQSELRKPIHVAFCLDYSGSMIGDGIKQLQNAMDYILTDKAEQDYLQFTDKDLVDVIIFGSEVKGPWGSSTDMERDELLNLIKTTRPTGQTALFPAAIQAEEIFKDDNVDKYNCSIVLMTDGEGNKGHFDDLKKSYNSLSNKIPIYSITFGDADESQLEKISSLTNGKIFDGKKDLSKAFRQVRGYN